MIAYHSYLEHTHHEQEEVMKKKEYLAAIHHRIEALKRQIQQRNKWKLIIRSYTVEYSNLLLLNFRVPFIVSSSVDHEIFVGDNRFNPLPNGFYDEKLKLYFDLWMIGFQRLLKSKLADKTASITTVTNGEMSVRPEFEKLISKSVYQEASQNFSDCMQGLNILLQYTLVSRFPIYCRCNENSWIH